MKKIICSLLSISVFSFMLIAFTGNKAQAQDVSVSYQSFYDELSPYGQWIDDPEYGSVWVPNEGSDFRPYGSRGYWAMTDYGNTWVSDDPWGWAVYHYGRWTYNPYYGWIWIPGYEWAPAWVSWRFGGGYCGWAPLGPGYDIGANYGCPDSWWVFTGPEYLYRHDHYNYWQDHRYNHRYINNTTIINNVYTDNATHVRYNYGPRQSTIEEVTHQRVPVYHVSQMRNPGATSVQRNTVNIYRPMVNRSTVNTAHPANVINAPMRIGKPQDATTNARGTQTEFRQAEQRQTQVNTRGANTQQLNRAEPQRTNQQQNTQTDRNQYFNHQPANNNQQTRNEQQPHFTPPQQQSRPEPQQRQEPQRSNPQPQPQRQEPQRSNPQPQQPRNNPQPQAPRPQPQQAPQQRGGGRR